MGREYVTELYDDDREPIPQLQASTAQNFLTEKLEHVIHLMKNGKATGPDNILADALKALCQQNIKTITDLCNIIYNTGYIPTDYYLFIHLFNFIYTRIKHQDLK